VTVLVFDLSNSQSFKDCLGWLEEARQSISPKSIIILVGNKSDLEEEFVNKTGSSPARDR
jgi:GTPase SAR1 family protein